MRIVSLLASGTELVSELGAGDQLVGRSHECDHPPWVRGLPVLSRPTFDVSGSSEEVDRLVREKLRAGEPLYEVDQPALAALSPEVIITQTHCEVCAVGPEAVGEGCSGPAALRREKVVTFAGGSLEGVLQDFLRVSAVIGKQEQGRALVERLRAHVEGFRRRTNDLARPRVVCLEWMEPPFAMGNWGPELVQAAGGEDALGTPSVHSRAISWSTVAAADPEILIVAPCGWGISRTRKEVPALLARSEVQGTTAYRRGQIYIADGNLYFNRSSPSLFATVDRLAEMIHPTVFGGAHEGRDYDRVL